jgi:hypothetical protein
MIKSNRTWVTLYTHFGAMHVKSRDRPLQAAPFINLFEESLQSHFSGIFLIMISLVRCVFILTLLFGFLNSAFLALEYENFGTVYHKLPHHTEYSKRGIVVTTSSRARYSESEDALSSFDITKNLEESELYLVKIVDNEKSNHVTKSFTKSVC